MVRQRLAEAASLLQEFRQDQAVLEAFEAFVSAVVDCFRRRGRVLVCGNGGSMCDAMHFAEEWSGRFKEDREPYPAIALSDPAHLSCVANDYGYEQVFARQVKALGHPGDVLVVLTTSGKSRSIVRAAEVARTQGLTVVGCLGKGGGEVRDLCDIVLHAPGETSDRIQELHMLALHIVIEEAERRLAHG